MKNSIFVITLLSFLLACQKNEDTQNVPKPASSVDISVLKDKFHGTTAFNSTVSTSIEGIFLVIKTNGIPDHKSPYFGNSDSRFEVFNGINPKFMLNPNSIKTQNFTFKIPLNPAEATSKRATPLGPIGVSLNGVPFYNQFAGPSQPLTNEINSFDQYAGHPQMQGQYHYHIEPLYLTKNKGSDAFLGLLLDGFPVYGPKENGTLVKESDLDAYHGHTAKTTEFPNGIYHYHITSTDPYLNGSGFFGTAGTVSQ